MLHAYFGKTQEKDCPKKLGQRIKEEIAYVGDDVIMRRLSL